MRISPEKALEVLKSKKSEFETLFEHGTLSVEIYRPNNVDKQQPHSRDELYVVISGNGYFIRGEERMPFGPGDFLFVPAFEEHRFVEFSEDFVTWVFFYGPEGGEKQ